MPSFTAKRRDLQNSAEGDEKCEEEKIERKERVLETSNGGVHNLNRTAKDVSEREPKEAGERHTVRGCCLSGKA